MRCLKCDAFGYHCGHTVHRTCCNDIHITFVHRLVEPDLYTYQMPEQLDDGWNVSSLQEEGMDTGVIEQVTSKIMSNQFRGIHSLLIVKNGVLVHEAYFADYTRNSLHTIYSITKSISSALIGIAIDQGLIHSIEDTVLSFFPESKSRKIEYSPYRA